MLEPSWLQWLTSEHDWNPPEVVKAETKAALPAIIDAINRSMAGAGAAILPLLAKLSVLMPSRAQSESELRMMAKGYAEYLGGFPFDVVAAAVDDAIKTLDWFPTIHQLRQLCERHMGPRHQALWRAKELLRRPTPEEQQAAAHARFEQIRAELARTGKRKPQQ